MNEKILKKISAINVKILQQEKLLKHYIENGWEYHEDTTNIKAKIYCYKSEAEMLKKQVHKVLSFV